MTEGIALHVYTSKHGKFAVQANDKIVNDAYQRDGCWERAEIEFLIKRCFPKGVGTYVDAGAHIGLTTIPIALAHPKVICHAFEPEATNHWLLNLNCENNVVKNVTTHMRALSDTSGGAAMIRDLGRTVDHRMLRGRSGDAGKDGEDQRPRFDVAARRLDHVLNADQIVRPLVMKMDVQGHELAVLRGALSLQPDVIIFEYWPYAMQRENETMHNAIAHFREYLYGAVPLDHSMILVPDLHIAMMQSIPWDGGKTTTSVNLVASRKFLP